MKIKHTPDPNIKTSDIMLITIVFISLLVFVFVTWLLQILISRISISPGSIILIHKNNPAVFIIDFIPLAGTWITWYFHNLIREKETKLNLKIKSLTDTISSYADDARKIAEKDYSFFIRTKGPDDKLGDALVLLQNTLRFNAKKETDQNWIVEGKDLISRILRINNNLGEMSSQVLKQLVNYIEMVQGAFYIYEEEREVLINTATYAYNRRRYLHQEFKLGHGLVGMCGYEMDYIYRTEIPDDYFTITSGILGDIKPRSILLIPLITDDRLQGVIECASLEPKIPRISILFLLELGEIIARTIYNLKTNQKTELLLGESRKMTEELQKNELKLREQSEEMRITQEKLRMSNEQLEVKFRELQNAEGRLHLLLENASEIISIYNRDLVMTYVSPSVTRILGYRPEEMMSGKDFERLSLEGARELRKLISATINNENFDQSLRYSFIKKDGAKIYLESSAKNLLDDPSINGIIVNSRDITERMRAEKEERLKTRMQSLSENSLDMIVRLNISGQFSYVNPAIEDYTGLEPASMINRPLSEMDFNENLKDYLENHLLQLIANPMKTNTELPVPVKLGGKITERILSVDAIPEFTNNELESILFIGHDITETKKIAKEIQIKNKNIEDSINYAERIQSSLLPAGDHLKQYFNKSFIYFLPRDVISGDFPWIFVKGDEVCLAAVDCTGHGVPGALLSFIGYFLMNNIVDREGHKTAAEICDLLHLNVRHTLKQDSESSATRDGMDMAFCKINTRNLSIQFSGAHRPLYHYSEGELTEYKGDHKSIGGITTGKMKEEKFTNHDIKVKKGDKIFIFSDGLPDQLGGPYGRKYSTKRIMDGILQNTGFTMQQYYNYFMNDFNSWKEGFKQLDDLLMIGIEF